MQCIGITYTKSRVEKNEINCYLILCNIQRYTKFNKLYLLFAILISSMRVLR